VVDPGVLGGPACLRRAGTGPKPDDKDVEIAVLRHQLAILKSQVSCPRYKAPTASCSRRWLLSCRGTAGVCSWSAPRPCCAGIAHLSVATWTYLHRGLRRCLPEETLHLVLRLVRENPRRRHVRIAGECSKLGLRVSVTSVRNIVRRHRLGPAPRRGGSRAIRALDDL
jgi:putative transposase